MFNKYCLQVEGLYTTYKWKGLEYILKSGLFNLNFVDILDRRICWSGAIFVLRDFPQVPVASAPFWDNQKCL